MSFDLNPAVPARAGSGDKTIKKWSGNVVDRTFSGHTDSVRALCEVPGKGFVSASHDATLRLWGPSGECITVFAGHTSLVYACAASSRCIASGMLSIMMTYALSLPCPQDGDGSDGVHCLGLVFGSLHYALCFGICTYKQIDMIVDMMQRSNLLNSKQCLHCLASATVLLAAASAGSEDKTMKIWSMAGECQQTIAFAGCIWSVAFLPSGDVVAGVSDSKAYVFSSDEIRQGPTDMHAAFEAEVAAHAAENAPTKGSGATQSGM